jgi:hypothetical protein
MCVTAFPPELRDGINNRKQNKILDCHKDQHTRLHNVFYRAEISGNSARMHIVCPRNGWASSPRPNNGDIRVRARFGHFAREQEVPRDVACSGCRGWDCISRLASGGLKTDGRRMEDVLRMLVWSSPCRMTRVDSGACCHAKVVNSVGRLHGREKRKLKGIGTNWSYALQVKVGGHPHEFEFGRQRGVLRGGVWPDRALEDKLPGLRVDDVQGIALFDQVRRMIRGQCIRRFDPHFGR